MAQSQSRSWKWRSQGGPKYGVSVNPEVQSVSCFPGGLWGDLCSLHRQHNCSRNWSAGKTTNPGLQMKKTARNTEETKRVEEKEARKPGKTPAHGVTQLKKGAAWRRVLGLSDGMSPEKDKRDRVISISLSAVLSWRHFPKNRD